MPTGFDFGTPSREDVYRYVGGNTQNLYQNVGSWQNPFSGVSGLGDLQRVFGLSNDVSSIYDPLKNVLNNQNARNMQGAALRAGTSATPGRYFSNVASQGANAMSNLLSQQGQAQQGAEQFNAGFLQNVLGQQAQWDMNRAGLQQNLLNGLFGNTNMFQSQQEQYAAPNFGDWMAMILPQAAKVGAAALGAPGT